MCGVMVRCGRCGLNQCSAGVGELEDGTECPECREAIRYMQYCFAYKLAPAESDLHLTTCGDGWRELLDGAFGGQGVPVAF